MRRILILSAAIFALLQGQSLAQSTASSNQCDAMLAEIASIDKRIADIEAERALTKEIREMSEAMDAVINELNESKDDAEAYEEKLEELQDMFGEKSDQLSEVLKETKAGTEKLKDSIGEIADNLDTTNVALQLYLERRKVSDNTNPAESLATLAKAYEALRGELEPLIDLLPVIGQFLKAYGEALKSAAGVAADLQGVREKQAQTIDQFPEFGGRNPFRLPTAKDKELKTLKARRTELDGKIRKADCTLPEPPENREVTEARNAAYLDCKRKLDFDKDPNAAYLDALRNKDKALRAWDKARKENKAAPGKTKDAEAASKAAKAALKNQKKKIQDALRVLKSKPGAATLIADVARQSPGFPETVSDQSCQVAAVFSAPPTSLSVEKPTRTYNAALQGAMKSYCDFAVALPDREKAVRETDAALAKAKAAEKAAAEEFDRRDRERIAAYPEITKQKDLRRRLQNCIAKNSGPLDFSGRYWHEQSGAFITIERHGSNHVFRYETPTENQRTLTGIQKGDAWMIGRIIEGQFDGLVHHRFPIFVTADWGCGHLTRPWAPMEGLIWAQGDWLSFFLVEGTMSQNCTYTQRRAPHTLYREGTKVFKRNYRP